MTSEHSATVPAGQDRLTGERDAALSKIITAWNLLATGRFRLFFTLLRRSISARVSDHQVVRVGEIRYRMYASTPSEYDLIEDDRELALLSLVRPGQFRCIYDIGANIGLHSIYYSHVAEQVVCFEPQPDNDARLRQNIELNQRSNIEAYPIAVSDVSGTVEFLVEPGVASQVNMLSHRDDAGNNASLQRIAVSQAASILSSSQFRTSSRSMWKAPR